METITLKVGGMTCGGCVASVTRVLKATPGVDEAVVRLDVKRISALWLVRSSFGGLSLSSFGLHICAVAKQLGEKPTLYFEVLILIITNYNDENGRSMLSA